MNTRKRQPSSYTQDENVQQRKTRNAISTDEFLLHLKLVHLIYTIVDQKRKHKSKIFQFCLVLLLFSLTSEFEERTL